jgi:hypothetical protein
MLKLKRKLSGSRSNSMSDSRSGPRSGPRSDSMPRPAKKQQVLPPIFTQILWGVESEYNGVRICNNPEFIDKIKAIFQAYCNEEYCKLKVTTESHKNNMNDDVEDKCFYIEFQIGIMAGFNYTLFENCCNEFKKFIKCVSKIHETDIPYQLEFLNGQKEVLYYFDEKNKVQKWLNYLSKNSLKFKQMEIKDKSQFVKIINREGYEQSGKPQLTMSMSIAEFPLVYFMYFRAVYAKDEYTHKIFVKSLEKTLKVFGIDTFTVEKFETLDPIQFRDMLIKYRDIIFEKVKAKYIKSKELQSKWDSSYRLFGDLLSFWGFILYVNMYIKSSDLYQQKYEYFCLPIKGKPPLMTKEEFAAKNYFKAFFYCKPRTKINLLYLRLSKILQEIIKSTKDCDLFEGCCVLYKDINVEGKKLLEDDDDPYDLFEFTKKQNVPYQITVEFRVFLKLLKSCLMHPSHVWFNADKYLSEPEKYPEECKAITQNIRDFMGYSIGCYTVDKVKEYSIYILEFYKPLFEKYSVNPSTDAIEEKLEANPTYTTSFKCEEKPEEEEMPGIFSRAWGGIKQITRRMTSFKNKKSKPKKIKSKSKTKSQPKKIKSKTKSRPKKIKSKSKTKTKTTKSNI